MVTDVQNQLQVRIEHSYAAWRLQVDFASGPQIVVLFGPSGCGKSTTLNCIAGLIEPKAGFIGINGLTYFDSEKKVNLRPQERHIGYVFQAHPLFPHLDVKQNILFGIEHLPRPLQEEKLQQLLALLHLEGLSDRKPEQLSGGQMQRVAVARALAINPKLLLLDEPFSALDRNLRTELARELKRLQAALQIPVVFVTHSSYEARLLADRIVFMDDSGRSRQGSLDDLQPESD